MIPENIRERFDLYRKWFRTLLVKEFLNLPRRSQEKLIAIVEKFLQDCKRLYDEGKDLKEKTIEIKILKVSTLDNREEAYVIEGRTEGSQDIIRLQYPASKKPNVGDKIHHTVFSMDGKVWFASKEEIIIKGRL